MSDWHLKLLIIARVDRPMLDDIICAVENDRTSAYPKQDVINAVDSLCRSGHIAKVRGPAGSTVYVRKRFAKKKKSKS